MKNLKLTLDLAIPLPGVYIKENKSFHKVDTCTCMLTEAQFTISVTWNQPSCPSVADWVKKMWYIYTTEYYAVIKKTTSGPCSNIYAAGGHYLK